MPENDPKQIKLTTVVIWVTLMTMGVIGLLISAHKCSAKDYEDWLTTTIRAGNGVQVPVADARYFTDGWGIIDGDTIQYQIQYTADLGGRYSQDVDTAAEATNYQILYVPENLISIQTYTQNQYYEYMDGFTYNIFHALDILKTGGSSVEQILDAVNEVENYLRMVQAIREGRK